MTTEPTPLTDAFCGAGGNGHPAPFPESLAKDHVASWSNPGDVVLDPFAGSGTTLKAAKELNRASGGSAAEIAATLLRETDNVGIGWGDSGLLHMVAERLGMPHESWHTERKVLDRIDRSNRGALIKGICSLPGRAPKRVRNFWLPEYYRQRWGEPPNR